MTTDSLPGDNNFPNYYRLLSESEINDIHSSTLEVLETAGLTVTHRGVIDLLVDAGCAVDAKTQNVKFPEKLVEQCLETTPSAFIMAGRAQKNDLQIGAPGKIYSRNGGGPGHVEDLETGLVRDASLSDVHDYAKLVDAVENLNIAAPIYAQDIEPVVRDLTVLATMFASTSKHINMRLLQLGSLRYVLKMAEIVAGSRENLRSRPIITLLESPVAPLQLPEVLIETLLACGAYGIPVEICSMPIAGATGPITLAGSLLLSNVEMVASIVVSQLANPGAPLVFTPRIMIMDMRSGHAMTGSIENALLAIAGVQLAKSKYNIPVNVHGPYTDSTTSDAQAGIENTYFTLLPALSGASILTGAGHLEGGLFVSFPQLIIDSEINGIAQRMLEGFEVNVNTLAVETIQRSTRKNNVLTDPHTRSNLRKINRYQPILLNRVPRQTWIDQGSPTMQDRARAMVNELLANHEAIPLDLTIEKELKNLLQHAKMELTS